jgi:dipeptidyl aminopeptidase/acylaminoacyl peptidase
VQLVLGDGQGRQAIVAVVPMVVSPYGFWSSPITSDLVVADAIRLDQVALDGSAIYWTESQPQKQGRSFVYRAIEGTEPELVTPDDENRFNVRTRVHEYGGGSFVVQHGVVYFSNFADQRLYRHDVGQQPRPITPPRTGALRYADGVIDRQRGRIICVREDHTVPGKVINTLVGIDVAGAREPQILASGNDFYSTPRLSPDGNRLVWLSWNHPNMPWVATEAWVGEIDDDGMLRDARRVAGGADEALFQPEWSPDGDLYIVSDRAKGWWNLYRERDGALEPMAPREAEFGRPQWTFGMSTYAFESAERLICCFFEDGEWNLAKLDTGTKRFDPIPTRFTDVSQLRASPGRAVFIGGTPTEPLALIDLDLNAGTDRVVRRSAQLSEEVRSCVSGPESITFTTQGDETAHAFFYPPFSDKFTPPQGEKTPVLVKSHGGPTASASSTLSLAVQFWTSRGIGVLDVNYRGSTGYGRSYRLRLKRHWGIFDVQDCVYGARHVIANRNADPERLMISGGSAGGYTTLCALTPEHETTFRAGASYYGVSDLAALARDTHKFESHYLDWLVGPYPRDHQAYVDRSPINHIDRLSVPVIFFQGVEDRIVPPNQTELMVAGLKQRGIPFGYFLFDGEQHGFRRAENIKRCLDAELYFYVTLLLRSGLHF